MPPKRREKDTDTGKNKPDNNGDHEQFLQAFESK